MSKKSVEEQLAEIKAKRQKLADEKVARDSEQTLADELERETQALADDEAIAELEKTHNAKRFRVVETPMGKVVVNRPSAAEFKRFADSPDNSIQAVQSFVERLRLYPSSERLDKILEEYPAVVGLLSTAAAELAGHVQKEKTAK